MRHHIIYIFLLFCSFVNAQTLSLEECRILAAQNNRTSQMAELRKVMAQKTLDAYKTNYLPKLSANGNYL